MEYYKVFRVENGKLYSAFEGWQTNSFSDYISEKRHEYKVRTITKDRKPTPNCPGLMVLCGSEAAYKFFRACYSNYHYVLHVIKPMDLVVPVEECSEFGFKSACTNSLKVGRRVDGKDKIQTDG